MKTKTIQSLLKLTFCSAASIALVAAPPVAVNASQKGEGSTKSQSVNLETASPNALSQEATAEQAQEAAKLQLAPNVPKVPAAPRSATAPKTAPAVPSGGGPVIVTATAGVVGPTNYANVGAAFAAVNAGTHQGDITVSIQANSVEGGPAVLNSSGAGSASYTSLLLRPTNDVVSITGATATGRGLIELNGADNVTIDGDNPNSGGTNQNLTIQNTAANTITFTSVVRIALAATLVTTANNDTVKNLNIIGSSPGRNIAAATSTAGTENTTFGFFAGPGASTTDPTTAPAAITSVSLGVGAGATASNLLVSNNNFSGSMARAINANGSATTVFPGLLIKGNFIGNATAGSVDQVTSIGITVQGSTNASVSGNTVYVEGYIASSSATQGINVGVNSTAVSGATLDSNKVSRARNNNGGTWSAFGINLAGGNNHIVQNNFVFDVLNSQVAGTGGFRTTFRAYGIRVASGTGHKVYHNSVHLFGVLPGATSTDLTVGFMITSTALTGCDVRNNIFSNQLTGGNPTPVSVRHACVYLPSAGTAAVNLTWNNNDFFQGPRTSGPKDQLAQVGSTAGTGEYYAADFDPTMTTPPANFRAYTSTLGNVSNDNASKKVDPQFVSNTDLHIAVASPMVDMGVDVGVTKDIDGQLRVPPPDIGVDDPSGTTPPANDIAAIAIVNPPNGSLRPAGSPFTVQASFKNVGTAAQANVPVRFKIFDAGMNVVYNQTGTIASIDPDQTVTVSFPNATLPAGSYTDQATAENPGDQNPANDSVSGSFTVANPLSGTVTVGTGGNFTSLTNPGGLFAAINGVGLSGNFTADIISDLTSETGAIPLNQWTEVIDQGGFTVTIRPRGAPASPDGCVPRA